MYLVEIETGREQMYQSVEALAAAIRNGVIGPDSRIFHKASSSWISITLHPEYRKAVAKRPPEPLPPLTRSQWTFFGTQPPTRKIMDVDAVIDARPGPAERAEPAAPRGLRSLFRRSRRASSDTAEQSGA